MPGGHHPCRPVEHRTEIVGSPQLSLAGRDPHPHRQPQFPLSSNSGIHHRPGRGESGTHPVTGVLEQETAVPLDRLV